MSIIIEIEDDEVFIHRNYYHKVCFPSWKEGDTHEVDSIEERHKCWECQEWIEAEQEMQALDAKLDPDGLDKEGQAAWEEYQDEEEFGTPNAAYCQSIEAGHNGGWFCYHPDCVTSHDEGLCEGCHRKEEICICGGIPEGF